jgi:hypothetical protein
VDKKRVIFGFPMKFYLEISYDFFFGPLIGVLGGVKVEKVCCNDYEIFKVYGTKKSILGSFSAF